MKLTPLLVAAALVATGCSKTVAEPDTSSFKPAEAPPLPPGPAELQIVDEKVGDGAEANADQVADGVHSDLRVVGAGLYDDVAAAAVRVELFVAELGQVDQMGWAAGIYAEPVFAVLPEEAGAEADGQGQSRG